MAVIPVEKVHIVVHKGVKEKFLQDLQKEAIVHITELEESTPKTSEDLTRINDALFQLSSYKKRSPLSMFFSIKRRMMYDTFNKSADSYDYKDTIIKLETVKIEREKSLAHLHQLQENITLLSPWAPFKNRLDTLTSFKQTDVLPVIIPSKEMRSEISEHIADIPHSVEHVNTIGVTEYALFFVKKEQSMHLRGRLIEQECDVVDFKEHSGTPAELISSFEREAKETAQNIETLAKQEEMLSKEIAELETTFDLLANKQNKEHVSSTLPETIRTTNIIGWVLKRHLGHLDALVKKAEYAFYEIIEPDPGERPPVALQNITFSKPYEMLIKLYSMPDPKEYDPTPFLAVFFPIMFGLCITDAVYGILLILISLFLMSKVTGDKSLFKILLVGGIFTIIAGAIVGGWVGDIFDYIGIEPLIQFKNSVMLFDPVKQPMIFIAIALGLGFIHMMIGVGIEIIDNFKNREYNQAIFANLTWFIIIPCIILYSVVFSSSFMGKAILELILWACIVGIIIASHPEGKPKTVDQLAWAPIVLFLWYNITSFAFGFLNIKYVIQIPTYVYLVAIPLLVFEFARRKEMKKVLAKVAWGLYNLYGISSYLGVLLSYVRLMALGMVTGVIAIAINKIAWMITGIPVIGVVLVIIILIPSHLFNLVINALGGFIHTMRLQYIEFFGRFYSGGSKPFKPFGFETNYVEIK